MKKYALLFLPQADEDISKIKQSVDKSLYKKLVSLLEELQEHPATGTGKPEVLKHYKQPVWSRRISGKHRLAYRIDDKCSNCIGISRLGALH